MGTIEEQRETIAALEQELAASQALAVEHYIARVEAERAAADAQRRGIQVAIRWIRAMPRQELLESRLRVGSAIYQRVASSVARYLEDRLDVCDEVTLPVLPSSSKSG